MLTQVTDLFPCCMPYLLIILIIWLPELLAITANYAALPQTSIKLCSYKAPNQITTGCESLEKCNLDALSSRCGPSRCHGRSGYACPHREAINHGADDDTN